MRKLAVLTTALVAVVQLAVALDFVSTGTPPVAHLPVECAPVNHFAAFFRDFFCESKTTITNRNYYINRDERKTGFANGQSYRKEWGHGLMANFESGFTSGPVGFGLDAFVLAGLKLDGGRGTAAGLLLPVDSRNRMERHREFYGGAVKMRVSDTVLKYGRMHDVELPIFSMDSRLLPEVAEGFLLTSNEIEGLEINLGHFTALKNKVLSGHDTIDGWVIGFDDGGIGLEEINFIGGSYTFLDTLTTSLYYSDVRNYWDKLYAGLGYEYAINDDNALIFAGDYYYVNSKGWLDRRWEVDSHTYSLALGYRYRGHTVSVAYQKSNGPGGMPYGVDGGGSVYLANSVQWSDFNSQGERSYKLQYDLDLEQYGVPGLSISFKYLRGSNIDAAWRYDGLNRKGKEWERDVDVTYAIQKGPFKDLRFTVRHATYRSQGFMDNVDQIRFIVEHTLNF